MQRWWNGKFEKRIICNARCIVSLQVNEASFSLKNVNNTMYPILSWFLLFRFNSYILPNHSSILPYLLINSPKPTLLYRISLKIASVSFTIYISPILLTSNPTTAFWIVYIHPLIIVPCDLSILLSFCIRFEMIKKW